MLKVLLFLFGIQNVSTFYVPGVAPNEFKLGEEIYPRVCASFHSKDYSFSFTFL